MTVLTDERIALRGGPRLRWGIAAPGGIARDFAAALQRHTDQQLVAVASRSAQRARDFADDLGIPHWHEGYDPLLSSDVDVVYVSSVTAHHTDLALRAIEAGKHVLVEKPMATSAARTREIRDAARARGVLVMEAMWTRYLPAYVELRRRIDDGALGDVRLVTGELGWRSEPGDGSSIWDAALGGGVTLDRGVYAFWFARFAAGPLRRVTAVGSMLDGVDTEVAVAGRTESGATVSLAMTMNGTSSGLAQIIGSRGSACMLGHLVFAEGFRVFGEASSEWRDASGLTGRDGLAWQAAALAGFVDSGLLDSPWHSLDDAVALAESMDEIRRLVGVDAGTSEGPGERIPVGG